MAKAFAKYDMPLDSEFDKALDEAAGKWGGSPWGSGSDGCTRDIEYRFPSIEAAEQFRLHVDGPGDLHRIHIEEGHDDFAKDEERHLVWAIVIRILGRICHRSASSLPVNLRVGHFLSTEGTPAHEQKALILRIFGVEVNADDKLDILIDVLMEHGK